MTSKMNASQKKTFEDIISFFQQSTSKFAANQKDALAIQQRVSESQTKLSFKMPKATMIKLAAFTKRGRRQLKKIVTTEIKF
ncbi:hypothetical protein [Bacillus safensis]|nr:hypothetical protein [Bacillus safensis]